MTSFASRDQFPALMRSWGLNGVGVEVGTFRGEFACHILAQWPGVLHCVDPWEYQPGYHDVNNNRDLPKAYELAKAALAGYVNRGRCVIHREYSVEFANSQSPSAPCDWAYIDALHDYENALADLRAWAPLIKPGGVLAGHDYMDEPAEGTHGTDFAVVSAVRTWCEENGYDPEKDVLVSEESYPSFVIRLRS